MSSFGLAMGGIAYATSWPARPAALSSGLERVDNVMTLKRFAIHPSSAPHRRGRGDHRASSSLETKGSSRRTAASAWASPRGGPHQARGSVAHSTVASARKLDLPNYAPEECPICKEGSQLLVHLGSLDKCSRAGILVMAKRGKPERISSFGKRHGLPGSLGAEGVTVERGGVRHRHGGLRRP